jgi:hypothetical protein
MLRGEVLARCVKVGVTGLGSREDQGRTNLWITYQERTKTTR